MSARRRSRRRKAAAGRLRFLPSGVLETRRGRWLQVGIVAALFFVTGYLIAAAWLFPTQARTAPAELREVPAVIGVEVKEARARLNQHGLNVVLNGEVNHPRVAPGVVLGQSPLAGQFVGVGDSVWLTLSAGPRSVKVPAVRGLSERVAQEILQQLGFTVHSRKVRSPVSGVEGTDPAAGEVLPLPSEVEIQVGEGPEAVAVPDLVGMHIDDVEALLQKFGLELGSVGFALEADEAPGRVIGQSPPAGYSLRGGGFVSVEVAGRPGQTGRR